MSQAPDPSPAADVSTLSAAPAAPGSRRRFWIILALSIAGLVVLAVVIAVISLYVLLKMEPDGWSRTRAVVASKSPEERTRVAQDLERRLLRDLFDPEVEGGGSHSAGAGGDATGSDGAAAIAAAVAPGLPRRVRVSHEEINLWLAARAREWATNRGVPLPAQMTEFMLDTQDGKLVLGCRYEGRIDTIFSVTMSIDLPPAGRARVRVEGVRAGRLPLPARTMAVRAASMRDVAVNEERVASIFDGLEIEPVARIDARRQLRLLAFTANSDGIDLTVRSEPRAPTAPTPEAQ